MKKENDQELVRKLKQREAELIVEFEKNNPSAAEGEEQPQIDPQVLADAATDMRVAHLVEREAQTLLAQEKFLEFFYVIPASVLRRCKYPQIVCFVSPTNENQGTNPETINADP